MPELPNDQGSRDATPPKYERRDVALRPLAKWMAGVYGLMVFGIVASAIYYAVVGPQRTPGQANYVGRLKRQLPPAPQIQPDPRQDLRTYDREQRAVEDSYGWVDRHAGIVRIPIERALSLTAARGLPYRH